MCSWLVNTYPLAKLPTREVVDIPTLATFISKCLSRKKKDVANKENTWIRYKKRE